MPYATEVTIWPVAFRNVMTPPVFVSDRLPREAVTTCALPKKGLGLVVLADGAAIKKRGLLVLPKAAPKASLKRSLAAPGEPPPKMTIAVPGRSVVPGAKR